MDDGDDDNTMMMMLMTIILTLRIIKFMTIIIKDVATDIASAKESSPFASLE